MESISLDIMSKIEAGADVESSACRTALGIMRIGYLTHNYLIYAVGCGLARAYCIFPPCCGGSDGTGR